MKPSEAIADARVILNDPSAGTPRWSDATLLGYFNDFLKALAKAQPMLFAEVQSLTFVAGALQSVSSGSTNGLLDILTNKSGQSVRHMDRATLENASRTWRSRTARAMESWARLVDGDPYRFLVFPPAAAADTAQALVAAIPDDVLIAAVADDLADVPATFKAPAAGYIAGRALAINTSAGDVQKGMTLVQSAMTQIGA